MGYLKRDYRCDLAVTRELPEREYCVQYRKIDLVFIERLIAEESLLYFYLFGPECRRCCSF